MLDFGTYPPQFFNLEELLIQVQAFCVGVEVEALTMPQITQSFVS